MGFDKADASHSRRHLDTRARLEMHWLHRKGALTYQTLSAERLPRMEIGSATVREIEYQILHSIRSRTRLRRILDYDIGAEAAKPRHHGILLDIDRTGAQWKEHYLCACHHALYVFKLIRHSM